MQVTLSIGGKFQAFHLAQELGKHGYLLRLLTTVAPQSNVVMNITTQSGVAVPARGVHAA